MCGWLRPHGPASPQSTCVLACSLLWHQRPRSLPSWHMAVLLCLQVEISLSSPGMKVLESLLVSTTKSSVLHPPHKEERRISVPGLSDSCVSSAGSEFRLAMGLGKDMIDPLKPKQQTAPQTC